LDASAELASLLAPQEDVEKLNGARVSEQPKPAANPFSMELKSYHQASYHYCGTRPPTPEQQAQPQTPKHNELFH